MVEFEIFVVISNKGRSIQPYKKGFEKMGCYIV
jgi:hypothetical protein